MDNRSISVVIPVYNAAARLDVLVSRVEAALGDRPYELVLVNDGSSDASWLRIEELSRAREARIRGLNLNRNYGQHSALLAGIRAARNDVIVTIDDDLQNPPEEIPRLLSKLAEGNDVVYGTPSGKAYGFGRGVATRLTKLALRLAIGGYAAANVSAFRAFRTDLRDAFGAFSAPYVSIDVLLSWGAARYESVPVQHHARIEGTSAYRFRFLATHALNILTGFTTRPLRIASLIGLLTTVFGLCVLAYVIVRLLIEGNPVPGFPFLASVIAIFSGAQLLALGIMGEYLARMHVRIMERPPYVVRDETGSGPEPK